MSEVTSLMAPQLTLSQAYAQAHYNLHLLAHPPTNSDATTLPALYQRTLDSLLLLSSLQSSSISASDTLAELPSSSLRLLLTPFFIAQTLFSFPGIDGRLARVRQSIASHLSFLSLLHHLDGLSVADDRRFLALSPSPDALDAVPRPADPAQARQDKIARYKELKALESSITLYQSRLPPPSPHPTDPDSATSDVDDESEAERLYQQQRLRWATLKAFDDVHMAQQELPLLLQRDALASSPSPPTPSVPAEPHRPAVYRVESAADLARGIPPSMAQYLTWIGGEGGRRVGRDDVFRDPNPATVSIEEWAEEEMRAGRLPGPPVGGGREARTREERGYVGRGEREEEGKEGEGEDAEGERGGEDEERVSERKAKESREWDNWKDDHEKGSGNRMGRR